MPLHAEIPDDIDWYCYRCVYKICSTNPYWPPISPIFGTQPGALICFTCGNPLTRAVLTC